MTNENTQPEPPQDGDLTEWVADSLVYIQNTTTTFARDFENFQGRVEAGLDALKNHTGSKQFDIALEELRTATMDFNKSGYEADMKRRTLGTWPIMTLGFVMLCALAIQTVVLMGGINLVGTPYLSQRNISALENCFQAVKENNTPHQCTIIVRPEDL